MSSSKLQSCPTSKANLQIVPKKYKAALDNPLDWNLKRMRVLKCAVTLNFNSYSTKRRRVADVREISTFIITSFRFVTI
jgi:hypothetical protein